jgi:hypothetical protein
MSLLRKMISSILSGGLERTIEGVIDAMPTSPCVTAEAALGQVAGQEEKNRMEPRRYFVNREPVQGPPTFQSFTAERALANGANHADEDDHEHGNPKQRRYFAKTGVYVDNEDELLRGRNASNGSEEVIPDKRPMDLKTLFPRLSLR